MNSGFEIFIKNILIHRCRINKTLYEKYFNTEDAKKLFIQAFTHKSVKGEPNYELLELEGDVIVNAAVVKYIRNKFPDITRVGYVTRIKHNLISKKTFSNIAIKHNYFKYVRISDEFRIEKKIVERSKDYININEDVIESICGVIVKILDNQSSVGVGFMACYNFISSYLNEMVIDTDYEIVFDSKTRLKQLADENKLIKFKSSLATFEPATRINDDDDDRLEYYFMLINNTHDLSKHLKTKFKQILQIDPKELYTNNIKKSKLLTDNQKQGYINILNDKDSKYISVGSIFDKDKDGYNVAVVYKGTSKDIEQDAAQKILDIYEKDYNLKPKPMEKN